MTTSVLTYYQLDAPPEQRKYWRKTKPGTVVATHSDSPWPGDKKYWRIAKKTSDIREQFKEPKIYPEKYWEWIRDQKQLPQGHLLEIGSHIGRTTGLLARRWPQITVTGINLENISISQGQAENFSKRQDCDITWHYSNDLLPLRGQFDLVKIEYPIEDVDFNHLSTVCKVGATVFFCATQGEFDRIEQHMKKYPQYTKVDNVRHGGQGNNRLSMALYSINNNGDHYNDTN